MRRKKEIHLKIPHINYTVVICRKKRGDIDAADGYCERINENSIRMVIPLPITGPRRSAILIHELVHVLQRICEEFNMSFITEREHFAYIADWLYKEICNL